jgi:hypothetical protein
MYKKYRFVLVLIPLLTFTSLIGLIKGCQPGKPGNQVPATTTPPVTAPKVEPNRATVWLSNGFVKPFRRDGGKLRLCTGLAGKPEEKEVGVY